MKKSAKASAVFFALLISAAAMHAAGPGTAQAQNAAAPATSSQAPLNAGEIDQLVAPIALYPDPLLSEVLMAATYPLEVVEANRWRAQNKALKDAALQAASARQGWDDSVKALTAVPGVLGMMSDRLDWTQKLGDAVLAQQADVMDAIQRLRQSAHANGKLETSPEQKVSVTREADKQYITIEPGRPETMYVPYYDPAIVYGTWAYPTYPPYYFPPPGAIAGTAIAGGLVFASGVAVGAWAANNNWWGGGFNWRGNDIHVRNDIDIDNVNVNKAWVHNPEHRQGVRYTNDRVRQKFAKGPAGDATRRLDFRGHDGQQVLKPQDDRTAGDRPDGSRPGNIRADLKSGNGTDRVKQAAARDAGKAKTANRASVERAQAKLPRGGGNGGAFANIDRGDLARVQANRGAASLQGHAQIVRSSFGAGGGRMGGGHMGGGMRHR